MANLESRRIADIDCHVITSSRAPRLIAVFCHGFGASGDDLVPVGAQLLDHFSSLLDEIQIVFPAGPLSLEMHGLPYGRAWWPLDMQKLMMASQQGTFRDLRGESPPELPQARNALMGVLQQLQQNFELPYSRFVIGGFSQGSMLATDVALHLDEPPGGLVVWSGTLLNEADWRGRMHRLSGVPIVQSHGRLDPLLPFEAATWLRDLFIESGANVQFFDFPGPHTIPPQALQGAGQLLVKLNEQFS
ncbi:alpha/beta hydrolase [Planctomicrobium sp. SH664]|uniref:alpha/beta hydrolase n=1 Tax=Planctomicrobium sp. SH664 TaxID=3448125 RepID=UPI003F5AEE10